MSPGNFPPGNFPSWKHHVIRGHRGLYLAGRIRYTGLHGGNVAKPKRKLTAAEKRAKRERQKKYQWIFINGKQVRVKRPETIEGLPVDEFIARNADPIWLHQNGMWEFIQSEPSVIPEEDDDPRNSTPF